YFQNLHGLGLSVAWSGPGFGRRELSAPDKSAPPANLKALIKAEGEKVLGKARFQEYLKVQKELASLRAEKAPGAMALCVTEAGRTAPDTFVLMRGNPTSKGDKVEPAF